jgi:membrane peptidoglycan carboxypeptidase
MRVNELITRRALLATAAGGGLCACRSGIPVRDVVVESSLDVAAHQLVRTEMLQESKFRTPRLDGAIAIIRNTDNAIVVYVQSLSPEVQFDVLRRGDIFPGSLVKPLVYGTALETGAVLPTDLFLDAPMDFTSRETDRKAFAIRNYGDKYTMRFLTIQEAIARSSNVVAMQVYYRTSVSAFQQMLSRLHLPDTFNPNLAAIGHFEVHPLDLLRALSVIPRDGAFVYRRKPKVQVFSSATTNVLADGMKACLQMGTGQCAADLADVARGKTGSSDSAMAILQTRVITALCWIGYLDRRQDVGFTGGSVAMPLLARIFRKLRTTRPAWFPLWSAAPARTGVAAA